MAFLFFKHKAEKKEAKEKNISAIESDKFNEFNDFLDALQNQSLIAIITGRRGSGKTALGFSLLEHLRRKKRIYVMGINARLPIWIKKVDNIQKVKNNSVLLIDEAAISFNARESTNAMNKLLTKLMAIARHKALSLIFISQSAAMIDINILRLTDIFIIKQPGLLQQKFERKEVRQMYEKVKPLLKDKDKSHAYAYSDWFEGLIKVSLPSFWNEKISKSFSGVKFDL